MEPPTENLTKDIQENASENNAPEQSAPAVPQQETSTKEPKKSKKEERSKKEDKSAEQFLKSLNSINSADEKLAAVSKKYLALSEDYKKLQFYVKQSDKRYALLLKEKDQLQHEFNKTILVKSKLENLCRELQKQNKAIKEESLLKIREEEERRKETQAKFQSTLSEITALLQQNNEKNAKLRDDNISMSEKFKSILQQYQLREQQVDKMSKQMGLENQLSETKLQKLHLEHQAEKSKLLADMEKLKMEAAQCHAKISELQSVEVALRGQIAVYTDKYDEFQNALVKSNQVFGGFKGEMEKMSKKIQKLEKESLSWKKRWESSQCALIDMCGERESSEQRVAAANKHLQQMQALCRTLQAERTVLINTLKEHNIERPPVPVLPPAPPTPTPPPPTTASNAKVDAMAANCAQLKQSLAHLQNQLNVLTTNKNGQAKEELPKPEKSKKKSKKNKVSQQADAANTETTNVTDADVVNAENGNEIEEKVEGQTENVIVGVNQTDIKNTEDKKSTDDVNQTDVKVIEDKSIEKLIDGVIKTDINSDLDLKECPVSALVTKENGSEIQENKIENDSSFVEPSSNDEISHIAEVKPILSPTEAS